MYPRQTPKQPGTRLPPELFEQAGLGLRRDLVPELLDRGDDGLGFIELAPENWMNIGGKWRKALRALTEKYTVTSHGLSLSLGSPDKLDFEFLGRIKEFLREFNIVLYSEHLSYTKCDNAHLYELLPIPFREDAVKHVAERIRTVQDFLGERIAIENVSYYTPVAPELDEATFVKAIVEEADCDLLLDVNNVFVNAENHKYDAHNFINSLPLDRVKYIHMAGHTKVAEDLIIDTHGEAVSDPVFDLFAWTAGRIAPVPVLLERDFNFPNFSDLESELAVINGIIDSNWSKSHAA